MYNHLISEALGGTTWTSVGPRIVFYHPQLWRLD